MNKPQLASVIRKQREALMARENRNDDDFDNAELLLCLARIVEGKTIERSFGAPGDWGYSNPIGKAIAAPEEKGTR